MQLAFRRFSDKAFPSYAFIPGKFPHPIKHPDGHSYRAPGVPAHPVKYYPPEEWFRSDDYLYGCDLYNHGYWWEAHEAWEGLWQLTDKRGVQGRFLQCLIQVSARHLKVLENSAGGVKSLGESSEKYFRGIVEEIGAAEFMGLEFQSWFEGVQGYYKTILLQSLPLKHVPEKFPYIQLSQNGSA